MSKQEFKDYKNNREIIHRLSKGLYQ